jgi:mono/diheme cytochrome c family protein
VRGLALVAVVLSLTGCEKLARNMYDDARVKPLQPNATRAVPAGAVERSRGEIAMASGGRMGERATQERVAAEEALSMPYAITLPLMQRGRERFGIYCAPCHGALGDGEGMIAHRGFPQPPSYHIGRLRGAPDRYFYDVITNGYGVMYPYADRVSPRDRWAIVAYIRALQLSQDAPTVVSARRPR